MLSPNLKQCQIAFLALIFTVSHGIVLANDKFAFAKEPVSVLSQPPNDDPRIVELGKLLFNDMRLSSDNTVACSSCHQVGQGGEDGLVHSIGVAGRAGVINAPTVYNASNNLAQLWDGSALTMEEQVSLPIHNAREMDSSWPDIVKKLQQDPSLVSKFNLVYDSGINKENIINAIVAYETQLITLNSAFDRYLSGEENAISSLAKEGYALFKKLGCVSCHQGRNLGGNMYQIFGVMGNYFEDRGGVNKADYGRYNVTGLETDRFKFKVPGLRNVAETKPYFHDGSVSNLPEAVQLMAEYQLGRPITENQLQAVVEFLHSLTGEISEHLQ